MLLSLESTKAGTRLDAPSASASRVHVIWPNDLNQFLSKPVLVGLSKVFFIYEMAFIVLRVAILGRLFKSCTLGRLHY